LITYINFLKDNPKMRDFRVQNKCNVVGAWLMLSLQDNEIPHIDEAVIVINLLVYYANVVVGRERQQANRVVSTGRQGQIHLMGREALVCRRLLEKDNRYNRKIQLD
jgi:hypothetical protein